MVRNDSLLPRNLFCHHIFNIHVLLLFYYPSFLSSSLTFTHIYVFCYWCWMFSAFYFFIHTFCKTLAQRGNLINLMRSACVCGKAKKKKKKSFWLPFMVAGDFAINSALRLLQVCAWPKDFRINVFSHSKYNHIILRFEKLFALSAFISTPSDARLLRLYCLMVQPQPDF